MPCSLVPNVTEETPSSIFRTEARRKRQWVPPTCW